MPTVKTTKCTECGSPATVKADGTLGYHVRVNDDLRPCTNTGAEKPKKAAKKAAARKKPAKST